MLIKENITVINQWQGRFGHDVKGIIIHSMWGTYRGSINWFKNPKAKASVHYCISKGGEISLTVPEYNTAWHSGGVTAHKDESPKLLRDNWGLNPNLITIGVELEDERNKNWPYPPIQYVACVELVADICKRYSIEANRGFIIMHREIDPINRSDPVGKWNHDKFIDDVKLILEKGGVDGKFYPWEGEISITHPVYVRKGPSTIYPLSGSKHLSKGAPVKVVGYTEGELYKGNKFWYKSDRGNYIWSGCTSRIPDENPVHILEHGENIKKTMTRQEWETKKTELEVKKSALELRKNELDQAVVENNSAIEAYNVDFTAFSSEAEPVVEVLETQVLTEVAPEAVVSELVAEAPVVLTEDDKKSKLEVLYEELKALLGK